jgi:hypothetical protein
MLTSSKSIAKNMQKMSGERLENQKAIFCDIYPGAR